MILADKIIEERKKNGWSQEELAERLGVSRQSVSKWEGAQSVPDLEKILKMSGLFGVSTDYLLKDEIEKTEYIEAEQYDENKVRKISIEEANEFLTINKNLAPKYAFATLLCVLSPAALILLGGMAEDGYMNENIAASVGMIIMIVLITVAITIFIICGKKDERFDFLGKELFDTAYGVEGMVGERKEKNDSAHTRDIVIGVAFCILGVIALFLIPVTEESNTCSGLWVAVMLAMESVGAFFLVKAETVRSGFDKLLQSDDYTPEKKRDKVSGTVSLIYWMIAVAVFLGLTLPDRSWEYSWIVFAIAGVLYPAMLGVVRLIRKK